MMDSLADAFEDEELDYLKFKELLEEYGTALTKQIVLKAESLYETNTRFYKRNASTGDN